MSSQRVKTASNTDVRFPDIRLRGVRVHNLREIDVDLPAGRLTVICGVSGSGKSSLAIDTLFAEGQRRFVESLPPASRRRLVRLDRPDADAIEGIPPAVAVSMRDLALRRRATVGTLTEISPFLRLLFARLGTIHCPKCGGVVERESPQTVAQFFGQLPDGCRAMVGFAPHHGDMAEDRPDTPSDDDAARHITASLREAGFHRVIVDGRTFELGASRLESPLSTADLSVIVDRWRAGRTSLSRVRESLELAFAYGKGDALLWLEPAAETTTLARTGISQTIDGRSWLRLTFCNRLACPDCGEAVVEPEPRLFNPASPWGACDTCEGSGQVMRWDESRIIANPHRTILGGAVGPWHGTEIADAARAQWGHLPELGIPLHVPYRDFTAEQRALLWQGVPGSDFPGILRQLDAWEARTRHQRRLLRWKSPQPCPACGGSGLNRAARSVTLGDRSIDEVEQWGVGPIEQWLGSLTIAPWHEPLARQIIPQLEAKLTAVERLGLDYLAPSRRIETLSRGELQRVALASALGSSLVHLLYVFDEPTTGLHPVDVGRLVAQLEALRDRGNTVVVIDHAAAMLRAADHLIELGPGGGDEGGRIVYSGSLESMLESSTSRTGEYLSGRRPPRMRGELRPLDRGTVRLLGAAGRCLQGIDVAFPLGVLCVVAGPSGSGKTTLVRDTLYRALAQRFDRDVPMPLAHDAVEGGDELDDVLLIDAAPLTRTARACPATYVKAFDEIRHIFAQTVDAQLRNYSAATFSFNNEGGRCEECRGEGYLHVDMSFLADARMKCPVCHGRRFRRKVLEVRHRGRHIADVLEMTARDAFAFFRGKPKVQTRLARLVEVGLGYLRLGQPLQTLSAGEAQRLKLAGQLVANRRKRTLFIVEEPTSGLHEADIAKVIDCFDSLLSVGHSLIVVDHHPLLIASADYVVELGPGAAAQGGRRIAEGRPHMLVNHPDSVTGPFLAPYFDHDDAPVE